jgi:tetratricopeptide (TPR) repeat protein
MPKMICIFLFLFLFSKDNIIFFEGSFHEAKMKAQNEKKMILLFFISEQNNSVIEKLNSEQAFVDVCSSYINLLVKDNTKEWNLLTKIFNVDSSGMLVLCNSDGSERDRIFVQKDIKGSASLLKNYNNNQKTLDFYLHELSKDSTNIEMLSIIASKYLLKGQKEKALEYYSKLIEKDRQDRYNIPDYPFYLLSLKKLSDSETETASKFVKKYPASKYLHLVYLALADHYIRGEDYKKARSTYDDYLKKFPNDPAALNNFAYLSTLLETELPKAMSSIERAIILSKDTYSKALYLDTKAEIFFKLKNYKEAIETEELAIEIIGDENKDVKKNLVDQLKKFKEFRK